MQQNNPKSCTIFYAWQSQLPNRTNRAFIADALERAAKSVREDVAIDASPDVDSDTANVPGSPNIADTIRRKIDLAEVVVCDVSIVQGLAREAENVRPTPNANVLIELGYAMKSLGTMDRVVLVMNTAFGGIENLPFDLRQYRPTTYNLAESATDKADPRKKLVSALEATFRDVLRRPSRHPVPDRDVELTMRYEKLGNSTGEVHYYILFTTLKNIGSKRIDDWYIEVDFPLPLLKRGTTYGALDRTEGEVAILRTKITKPILSREEYVFRIEYEVNDEIFSRYEDRLAEWSAIARAYVKGERVAEAILDKLQRF